MIDRGTLASYLASVFHRHVEVLTLRRLTGAEREPADDPKGFGYGVPFEVECLVGGASRTLVIESLTMSD